jgi:hypothetical protein
MNLTKPITIPYSDSRTPTVNNPTENVRRRICLCVTFNQLVTSSVNEGYYFGQTGFNFYLSSIKKMEPHESLEAGLAGPRGIEPLTYGLRAST